MDRPCLNCGMTISENTNFCPECGCELLHEHKTPSKEQNPTSPSVIESTKKGFGIGAKIGLVIGIILFLIIAVGFIVGPSNTEPSSSNTSTLDEQAVHFVQNYNGTGGSGVSISQIVTVIVYDAYLGENILDNPSTEHGWTALRDYNQNGNVWRVEFDLKTYRENVKIVWYANMDTHTVYSGDTIAKNILDAVNLPSNSFNNNTLSNIHLT